MIKAEFSASLLHSSVSQDAFRNHSNIPICYLSVIICARLLIMVLICFLAHQHGVIISKRTLQRLCRKLNLFRRKNQTDIEEIASFVQSEMATSGRLQGYRWLHLRAIRRGYVVSQETMRMVIKEIDPEGVEASARSTSPNMP